MAINTALKTAETAPASAHFLESLHLADTVTSPYTHWLLDEVLPQDLLDGLEALPFTPPDITTFGGSRECNNSTRVYFSKENQEKYAICRETVDVFTDPAVIDLLKQKTGAKLDDTYLRIEYCQDTDGFWLAPHPDISVKMFTMMLYLSDDPNIADAGTDIYDATPEHNYVASAPYGKGKAMIFVPASDTFHGYSKRKINGLRKALCINYVTKDWRNVQELANYEGGAT